MAMLSKDLISSYIRHVGLSALIGLLVGLAIVVFFNLYSELWDLFVIITRMYSYAVVFIPVVGFTLAYSIVKTIAKTKTTGCGTHVLLEVYRYEDGVLPEKDTVSKTLASAMSIGLGGSARLEGPSLL